MFPHDLYIHVITSFNSNILLVISLVWWIYILKYNIMRGGLCEKELLDKAKELLIKMEENCCLPNGLTLNRILRAFLKGRRYSEAVVFFEDDVCHELLTKCFYLFRNNLSTRIKCRGSLYSGY